MLPLLAAAFALPQFAPQLSKLRRGGDVSGISSSWPILTCINNIAWIAYFVDVGYLTAIVPNMSVVVMSAVLAVQITRRRRPDVLRPANVAVLAWSLSLLTVSLVWGSGGLGSVLAGAFVVQVTPSLWTAFRTASPTGISVGTWQLVLCEMSCWLAFGVGQADSALAILGVTGVAASLAMVWRGSISTATIQVDFARLG